MEQVISNNLSSHIEEEYEILKSALEVLEAENYELFLQRDKNDKKIKSIKAELTKMKALLPKTDEFNLELTKEKTRKIRQSKKSGDLQLLANGNPNLCAHG